MRASRRSTYSNRRRRKNIAPLYLQFRCEPDPWNGSPPKTPPSTDDEEQPTEYALTSNSSLFSVNKSSTEKVALAPILNSKQNKMSQQSNYRGGNRRLNEVKRKLSKYVKMENANVLQSHQSTQKQTKLHVRKTAPVPLPFGMKRGSKSGSVRSNAAHSSHNKKPTRSKQSYKKTAPAPRQPPASSLQSKPKSKPIRPKAKTAKVPAPPAIAASPCLSSITSTSGSTSKASIVGLSSSSSFFLKSVDMVSPTPSVAQKFISISPQNGTPSTKSDAETQEVVSSNDSVIDEVIEFNEIPEAYYLGVDPDALNGTANQVSRTIDKNLLLGSPISTAESSTDPVLAWELTAPPVGKDSVRRTLNWTSSDSAMSARSNTVLTEQPNIQRMLEEPTQPPCREAGRENDVCFSDDKFKELADQILNEPRERARESGELNPYAREYVHNAGAATASSDVYDYEDEVDENKPIKLFYPTPYAGKAASNIWTEPKDNESNSPYRHSLGGLLSHGLPPISQELFKSWSNI